MAREQQAAVQAAAPVAEPIPSGPGTIEVAFIRRWRGYEAGDRANFVPAIARDLVAIGYGTVPGMVASPSRTPFIRK